MNVLVAPKGCESLIEIRLPRPSDGAPQSYMYDEPNMTVYECVQYEDQFRSWFLDNHFCREGRLTMLSRVDPLLLLLPHLARHASDRYRTIQDVCARFSEAGASASLDRLDYVLAPGIEWSLVCDTRELDDEMFVRYNETRTLEWLIGKHEKCMGALREQLGAQPSKATLISHANDLIGLYLEPGLLAKLKQSVIAKLKS